MSEQNISYSPTFTIKEMIECGVHFGHKTNRWNPKMRRYIYGAKSGIHIIDLQQTAILLAQAAAAIKEVAIKNGRILIVGTKRQAADIVSEYAKRCGQNFVNKRWLGGMLTNWKTIAESIKRLAQYEAMLSDETLNLTKKERLNLSRKYDKLESVLGGIRNMGNLPDAIFVLDTRQEALAIQEAKKLGILVIAIVDTNASFDGVDYIIPGNDDARKAIELYCRVMHDAIIEGIQESAIASGEDLGEAQDVESGGPDIQIDLEEGIAGDADDAAIAAE